MKPVYRDPKPWSTCTRPPAKFGGASRSKFSSAGRRACISTRAILVTKTRAVMTSGRRCQASAGIVAGRTSAWNSLRRAWMLRDRLHLWPGKCSTTYKPHAPVAGWGRRRPGSEDIHATLWRQHVEGQRGVQLRRTTSLLCERTHPVLPGSYSLVGTSWGHCEFGRPPEVLSGGISRASGPRSGARVEGSEECTLRSGKARLWAKIGEPGADAREVDREGPGSRAGPCHRCSPKSER